MQKNDVDEQDRIDEYYAKAEAILAEQSVLLIQHYVQIADDCADDPIATRCYTEVLGRNAKKIQRAVERHSNYFALGEGESRATVDEILALVYMAELSEEMETPLFAKWEAEHWPAWKVLEEVNAIKRGTVRASQQVVTLRGDTDFHGGAFVEITPVAEAKLDGLANDQYEWRAYRVNDDKNKET